MVSWAVGLGGVTDPDGGDRQEQGEEHATQVVVVHQGLERRDEHVHEWGQKRDRDDREFFRLVVVPVDRVGREDPCDTAEHDQERGRDLGTGDGPDRAREVVPTEDVDLEGEHAEDERPKERDDRQRERIEEHVLLAAEVRQTGRV